MPPIRAAWRAAPAVAVATLAAGLLAQSARADSAGGLGERLWLFAGNFHPLVVHFPIAGGGCAGTRPRSLASA